MSLIGTENCLHVASFGSDPDEMRGRLEPSLRREPIRRGEMTAAAALRRYLAGEVTALDEVDGRPREVTASDLREAQAGFEAGFPDRTRPDLDAFPARPGKAGSLPLAHPLLVLVKLRLHWRQGWRVRRPVVRVSGGRRDHEQDGRDSKEQKQPAHRRRASVALA